MILYEGGPDVPLREFNSSLAFYTGKVYPTKEWGSITIIGQERRYDLKSNGAKSYRYFVVQFEDGTKVQTWGTNIKKGLVKNPNQPSVYKVGFMGQGKHKASVNRKHTKEYNIWISMLLRCYNEEFKEKHPTYKDCAVARRWHNFQNVADDIQHLNGYFEWKNTKGYDLDKDIKVKGNKIYSKNTCMFIPQAINKSRGNTKPNVTGLTYIATRLSDGHTEEFTNQTEFAEKHGIPHPSYISAHILGKQNSLTNWKIAIKVGKGEQ